MTREEQKIQREIDFTDWWLREHKMEGAPTYADAIAWADRTMIEKACSWLLKGGYFVNNTETINDFKRAMEE